MLYCIYDRLRFCKQKRMILNEMKRHFDKHPGSSYKYRKSKTDNRDFNRDVGIILGADKWIVHEKRYNDDSSMTDLTFANLILSYDDYQRMLSIYNAWNQFIKEHPFCLTRLDVERELKIDELK